MASYRRHQAIPCKRQPVLEGAFGRVLPIFDSSATICGNSDSNYLRRENCGTRRSRLVSTVFEHQAPSCLSLESTQPPVHGSRPIGRGVLARPWLPVLFRREERWPIPHWSFVHLSTRLAGGPSCGCGVFNDLLEREVKEVPEHSCGLHQRFRPAESADPSPYI